MVETAVQTKVAPLGDCQCNGGQPKNFVVPCLLLLLSEGPAHGYDLMERLASFGFSSDPPVVYRNLRRMERDGLVSSAWDTRGKGAARRVYHPTQRGLDQLDAWEIAIQYQRDVLDSFLQRHAFSGPSAMKHTAPLSDGAGG